MGYDVNYRCLSIEIMSELQFPKKLLTRKVYLCSFQCENEHGHKLKSRTAYVDNEANIVKYPENILIDDITDEDFNKLQRLLNEHPGPDYDFYNMEEIADMIKAKISP